MLYLRVLSGLREGASAPLQQSRYVCGVGLDCDFIVGALEPDGERIILSVSEGGLSIAAVRAAGDAESLPKSVQVGEIFDVGPIKLVVSEEDPMVRDVTEEAVDNTSGGYVMPDSRKSSIFRGHERKALSFAVVAGLFFYIYATQISSANGTSKSVQTLVAARLLLNQSGLGEVLFPIERAGQVSLVGYFPTEKKRQAFRIALENRPLAYPLRLQLEADLLGRMERHLSVRGSSLRATMNGLGRVQLTGLLLATESLSEITEELGRMFADDVLGIDHVLAAQGGTERILRSMLADAQLPLVSVAPARPNAPVTTIVGGGHACLQRMREQIVQQAHQMRTIFQIDLVSTRDRSLALGARSVQKIVAAPYPFVMLANGETIFTGGELAGDTVKQIAERYVFLANGDVLSEPGVLDGCA